MDVVSFTLHNPQYKRRTAHRPQEDVTQFRITRDRVVACVADGITRDSVLKRGRRVYPNPSPAREAAEAFCDSFIAKMKSVPPSVPSLRSAMRFANNALWSLNKDLEVNYLDCDYAGCVASCAVIAQKTLYYGFLTDCGVCVFDRSGTLKFRTPDEGPSQKIASIISKHPKKFGTSWNDPRWRARVRSHFRNNPSENHSYGALTGESVASEYFRVGKRTLCAGDYVILYSDGMIPLLFSPDFNPSLHFRSFKQYVRSHSRLINGSEASVVGIVVPN